MIKGYNQFLNEAYYEDLSPFEYGMAYPECLNIGWLDEGQPYEKGNVPDGFVKKLEELPVLMKHMGHHDCPFCGKEISSVVKFAKGDNINYLTPGMISHYVEKHEYKPPQEFIDAVMNNDVTEKQAMRIISKAMEKDADGLPMSVYFKKIYR